MGPGLGQFPAGSGIKTSREYKYRFAVSDSKCRFFPKPTQERRVLTVSFLISFNDIAWTTGDDNQSRGIIAGALENGSLDLWDADKLLSGNG